MKVQRDAAELLAENAMLLNAIQSAQALAAERKYDEAEAVLNRVIRFVLRLDAAQ